MATSSATTNTTPGSCKVVAVNVRSCLRFDVLWNAHPLNWHPPESTPFRDVADIYPDQCAMKMSIALLSGGLTLDTFPKSRTEKRFVATLKQTIRAAIAAEELANWLIKVLGKPEHSKGWPATRNAVLSRQGIIFFKDFWQRPGESAANGDHIDLWKLDHTPNTEAQDYLTIQSDFNPEGRKHYFEKEVWFWELA